MFAVLKTGGKQYKVQAGDILRVELLAAEAGEKVQFNEILMVGGDKPQFGTPLVEGAAVQAEVIDNIKADKVITYHKRRRKHSSQRTRGHRQQLTLLRVTDVLASGAEKSGVKEAVGTAIARRAAHGTKGEAAAKPAAKKAAAPKAAPKAAEAAVAEADDLKVITGLGPAAEKKLNEAGITTFAQLASVDPETFEATKVKPDWVEQAKELAK
ncbi:50S ribosomal protein L21 [Thioclava atlantica]|uniref:Large ribosomal subunit protein bL21 n=1 Tax=Thioclava atlantica TaxID=1317124 RepID=A0A085TSP1_9RHOB|nr:50S ribosomal protein L21 [Thioclava atlantica]KFE33738.1 50S ribosomal protein L21/unknown domain fusion protein [Thioclava atlantica]